VLAAKSASSGCSATRFKNMTMSIDNPPRPSEKLPRVVMTSFSKFVGNALYVSHATTDWSHIHSRWALQQMSFFPIFAKDILHRLTTSRKFSCRNENSPVNLLYRKRMPSEDQK
jgi:hypothetical protein